ncbi:hypothetical protein ABZ741_37035 [Streptomyces globisporus]|uniref:hypothetical protein n=1 Tax=Streptomyces globisporus TaxID=1908 RepID=UPI003460BA71
MASTKTTYSTTHPTTGKPVTFTKGGRRILWITWADFGDGFVHAGFSSQDEHKKAVRAPRSSNPYATRYEATAATAIEDKPAEQPQHEADPTPAAEEAPAPVVTPAEVAEALDRIAVAHSRVAPDGQAEYLPEVLVHLLTYGLPYEADDDAFGARRAELRRSGRLPHVEALVVKVRAALRAYVGDRYNRVGVTPAQIRHAARTVRLIDGDEKQPSHRPGTCAPQRRAPLPLPLGELPVSSVPAAYDREHLFSPKEGTAEHISHRAGDVFGPLPRSSGEPEAWATWWKTAASVPTPDFLGLKAGDEITVQLSTVSPGTVARTCRFGALVRIPLPQGPWADKPYEEMYVTRRNQFGHWYR